MPVSATQNNPNWTRSYQTLRGDPRALTLPVWAHPEYKYWYCEWTAIREAAAGEREVKNAGRIHLPHLSGMEDDEYQAFLERATYYNFTGRTISALSGSIFRRKPLVEGLEERFLARLEQFSCEGETFETFANGVAEEDIALGRIGVLIDYPEEATSESVPYATVYTAESIVDWDLYKHPNTGQYLPSRLVLREVHEVKDPNTLERQFYYRYRELVLESPASAAPVYTQYVWQASDGHADLAKPEQRSAPIVPTRFGEPLTFIPFRLFGPFKSSWNIEKPPCQDIARLNLSHYRSYAQLEHGRLFAGFPIYHQEVQDDGAEEDMKIGSSHVWQHSPGNKPGILELNGQGLKFLENALDQKAEQAATIGGRMMGVRGTAVSESDNQLKLAERNEQSILLKIARALDEGFTEVMRWWAWWQGTPQADLKNIVVTFNKDFLFDAIGAREFRAIHAMYKDGVLPIEVVYDYFRRCDVIPDWMTLEEFRNLLEKTTSFPNQPDAEARAEGYPTAKDKLAEEEAERQREHEDEQAAAARKSAEKQARERPAPAPNMPGMPGGPGRPPGNAPGRAAPRGRQR